MGHFVMPLRERKKRDGRVNRERDKQRRVWENVINSPERAEILLFVLRFYGPVNLLGVMSSAVSLSNHTFTGQL